MASNNSLTSLSCLLCYADCDPLLGEFLPKYSCHLLCLRFAAGIPNKTDFPGEKVFIKEVNRAKKTKCKYCFKPRASLGCLETKCRASYHVGCGRENGAINIHDTFVSFCKDHCIRQIDDSPSFRFKGEKPCKICGQTTTVENALTSPCCKKVNHKTCTQAQASTGQQCCPNCKKYSKKFFEDMLYYGIYFKGLDGEKDYMEDGQISSSPSIMKLLEQKLSDPVQKKSSQANQTKSKTDKVETKEMENIVCTKKPTKKLRINLKNVMKASGCDDIDPLLATWSYRTEGEWIPQKDTHIRTEDEDDEKEINQNPGEDIVETFQTLPTNKTEPSKIDENEEKANEKEIDETDLGEKEVQGMQCPEEQIEKIETYEEEEEKIEADEKMETNKAFVDIRQKETALNKVKTHEKCAMLQYIITLLLNAGVANNGLKHKHHKKTIRAPLSYFEKYIELLKRKGAECEVLEKCLQVHSIEKCLEMAVELKKMKTEVGEDGEKNYYISDSLVIGGLKIATLINIVGLRKDKVKSLQAAKTAIAAREAAERELKEARIFDGQVEELSQLEVEELSQLICTNTKIEIPGIVADRKTNEKLAETQSDEIEIETPGIVADKKTNGKLAETQSDKIEIETPRTVADRKTNEKVVEIQSEKIELPRIVANRKTKIFFAENQSEKIEKAIDETIEVLDLAKKDEKIATAKYLIMLLVAAGVTQKHDNSLCNFEKYIELRKRKGTPLLEECLRIHSVKECLKLAVNVKYMKAEVGEGGEQLYYIDDSVVIKDSIEESLNGATEAISARIAAERKHKEVLNASNSVLNANGLKLKLYVDC